MSIKRLLLLCRLPLKYVAVAGLLAVLLQVAPCIATDAKAASPTWISEQNPAYILREDMNPTQGYDNRCTWGNMFIGSTTTDTTFMCMWQADGWQYGLFSRQFIPDGFAQGLAVRFATDNRVYRVEGSPAGYMPLYVAGSNHLLYTNIGVDGETSIVKNLPTKLTRIIGPDLSMRYKLKDNAFESLLKDAYGDAVSAQSVAVSHNGRWLVASIDTIGLVRVDMESFQMRHVSHDDFGNYTQLAISNDGLRVATTEQPDGLRIIQLDDGCGTASVVIDNNWKARELDDACPSQDLRPIVNYASDEYLSGIDYPSLNDDGTELTIRAQLSGRPGGLAFDARWLTLSAPGYFARSLEYLALGDSFSSGEGDTESNPQTGRKYYLDGTDIEGSATTPEEKCHISSRSYPFMLAITQGLPGDKMQSVACSGAHAAVDYAQEENDGYLGQANRLKLLDRDTRTLYKAEAKEHFIPGRVQQIEFVKKYKPRAITLTAGGNDADFGGIIGDCGGLGVCSFANTSFGKARVGNGIQAQYAVLRQLYIDIQRASPTTKIYVIGYPQFFSAEKLRCPLNVRLSQEERQMVHEAVIYMNNVIESAARSAGVKYIDVENSLGSHKLCDDEEPYVTGLARSGKISTSLLEMISVESFHPNAKGNKALAERITTVLENKTFNEYRYCPVRYPCPDLAVTTPPPTPYFSLPMAESMSNIKPRVIIAGAHAQKGISTGLATVVTGLEPGSEIQGTMFSDPIDLGKFTVDGDGNFIQAIPIPPNLPAGIHILQLKAKTYSGEDVIYWQVIEVLGVAGDVDENGVPDSQQTCLAIPDFGLEVECGVYPLMNLGLSKISGSTNSNVSLPDSQAPQAEKGSTGLVEESSQSSLRESKVKEDTENTQGGRLLDWRVGLGIVITACFVVIALFRMRRRRYNKRKQKG